MIKNTLIILSITLLTSCGNGTDEPTYNPTAYNFNPPTYFGDYLIPSNNALTDEGVALGRMLFYEKRLSEDNSISCASCHEQEKAFTDGLAVSVGIHDLTGTKSAMSMSNLMWTSHFFWNGRAATLEQQALEPIENPIEMNQSLAESVSKLQATDNYPTVFFKAFGDKVITSENIGKALAQFMRTMISSDSKYDQYLLGNTNLTAQEEYGMELFFTHPIASDNLRGGNCGDCHVNILTSGFREGFQGFKNNGLDDDGSLEDGLMAVTGKATDKGKFKIPTLRNIALTAPYMHDGRFATLEDVLNHYNEHVKRSETLDPLIMEGTNNVIQGADINLGLTAEEKEAIIVFLHTLTDNNFITNEALSNPFE